jgi:hypothetical protein
VNSLDPENNPEHALIIAKALERHNLTASVLSGKSLWWLAYAVAVYEDKKMAARKFEEYPQNYREPARLGTFPE